MPSVFDRLLRDVVYVAKQDGSRNGPHKASVQGDLILTHSTTIEVSEGDAVERELPGNKIEVYRVLEASFVKGLHRIPDAWNLAVRKEGSLRPQHVSPVTNIHIANAGGIQIGNYNVQQISSMLNSLVETIEKSAASPEEKSQAKSSLAEFLRHPAVTAILGGTAGAIAKTLMGS